MTQKCVGEQIECDINNYYSEFLYMEAFLHKAAAHFHERKPNVIVSRQPVNQYADRHLWAAGVAVCVYFVLFEPILHTCKAQAKPKKMARGHPCQN